MGRMMTSEADYVGKAGAAEVRQCLLGLEVDGRRAARNGDAVLLDGKEVGVVTSGSFAPSLGKVIAFAWVNKDAAEATAFTIRAARAELRAVRAELPFYKDGTARKKLS